MHVRLLKGAPQNELPPWCFLVSLLHTSPSACQYIQDAHQLASLSRRPGRLGCVLPSLSSRFSPTKPFKPPSPVLALAPADLPLVLAQRDLASDAGTAREATAALAQHANKALHEGGPCAAPCVDWFQSAQTCSGDGVDGQTAATQCACDPTFVGGSTICAWCIGFEALNEARSALRSSLVGRSKN